jgi:hypothetical protein
MVDQKVTSNGNVTVWWVPAAGVADYRSPTAAEINAGVDLTSAIAWDSYEIAASESNDVDDRALIDKGNAVTRGFQQFAASFNIFRDVDASDTTSPYVQAFETFRTPRQYGYLITRVLQKETGTSPDAVAGQWISVFRFVSDAVGDDTEGEDSYKMTLTFMPQGEVKVYTQVKNATAVTVAPTTLALDVGDVDLVTATLGGKSITQGATWRSDDTTVATVSANGVVTAYAAGTANITANHNAATGPGTCVVTVT